MIQSKYSWNCSKKVLANVKNKFDCKKNLVNIRGCLPSSQDINNISEDQIFKLIPLKFHKYY